MTQSVAIEHTTDGLGLRFHPWTVFIHVASLLLLKLSKIQFFVSIIMNKQGNYKRRELFVILFHTILINLDYIESKPAQLCAEKYYILFVARFYFLAARFSSLFFETFFFSKPPA
jgi:hypothetical protein